MPSTKYAQQQSEGSYTFQSKPRPIERHARCFYHDADPAAPFGNIMWDRRVIRGNTYGKDVIPLTLQPDPAVLLKRQEIRRRAIAKRRLQNAQMRAHSPDPLAGRRHAQVQTELYLEEICDRIEEADADTQTDAFLDRPPTPLFVPAKTGMDVATQILEGELFDFDLEVKPIVEVLVGKTIEQALIEVLEEEELADLRQQQREFEELRNAELAEMQRLEEQERRHKEEKERRMQQQREVLQKERETADKITARAFAINYVADLVPNVFDNLRNHGYFYDPVERDIERGFMPFLTQEVIKKVDNIQLGRTMLDKILCEVAESRLQAYKDNSPAPAVESRKPSNATAKSSRASANTVSDQPASQPKSVEQNELDSEKEEAEAKPEPILDQEKSNSIDVNPQEPL